MDLFFIRPLYPLRISKRNQVFCAIRANGRLADLRRADQLVSHVNSRWFPPTPPLPKAMPSFGAMHQDHNQCLADVFALVSKLLTCGQVKISGSSDFLYFYCR